MTLWTRGTIVVSALAFCAIAAQADPIDDNLDGVLGRLNAGDSQGAIAALDGIQNPTPAQLIRARYYRAYAYKRQGDKAQAIAEFQKFVPSATTALSERQRFQDIGGIYATKARYVYCEALFEAGRYLEAAQAYGQFAADLPTHEKARDAAFRKEESLRNAGRYQEAYDHILKVPTPDADTEIRVGVRRAELLSRYLRTDYDLSNRLCEELIAKYPDHPTIAIARWCIAWNLLENFPPDRRDPARARQMLRALVADFPQEGLRMDWEVGIAQSFFVEKDYINSIAQYDRLISQYPDTYPKENWHSFFRFMQGEAYHANGMLPQALSMWRTVTTKYPGDDWAVLAKARIESFGGER